MYNLDNLKEEQILYVLMPDGETIKRTRILEVVKDYEPTVFPERWLRVVTRYVDSKTNGTVTFFSGDFGYIIFLSIADALRQSKEILTSNTCKFYGYD